MCYAIWLGLALVRVWIWVRNLQIVHTQFWNCTAVFCKWHR